MSADHPPRVESPWEFKEIDGKTPQARKQPPLSDDNGLVQLSKSPGTNHRNEPNSDDSEERRRNCPLCYNRVSCYCACGSDSDDSDAAAVENITCAKKTSTR